MAVYNSDDGIDFEGFSEVDTEDLHSFGSDGSDIDVSPVSTPRMSPVSSPNVSDTDETDVYL